MAEVTAVNISEKKGIRKHEVAEIELLPHHGIVGDAHAGDWHRQVSLLAEESVDQMRALGLSLTAGAFAENINTVGICLKELPVQTAAPEAAFAPAAVNISAAHIAAEVFLKFIGISSALIKQNKM